MRKKLPEEFGDENWTQGSYTIAKVVRDCCPEVRRDLSMCGYLYPCAISTSHTPSWCEFGLVVCARVGGMRCREVCAVNQGIPVRFKQIP